jgi:hypothetical protein
MRLPDLISRWVTTTDLPVSGFRKRLTILPTLDRTRPLAFMHIPKTSGSAIKSGLTAALAPVSVGSGFDHSCFGSYQDFDSIDPAVRCGIYDSPASLPPHADLVVGHIACSTLLHAYPQAQRLTLLREPFSRLLSHWLFWRQHTDTELAPWGNWANRVRVSRQPLADFLSDPTVACQTDNLTLRMLLWPHPLLPADGFIDPAHDERLVREATARLLAFDFVDIIDNGTFVDRLASWLGQRFHYEQANETQPIPVQFRSPLHRELTVDAVDLLEFRSRLDCHLWSRIAARHIPSQNVSKLRGRTILTNVARYGVLMAPIGQEDAPERPSDMRASWAPPMILSEIAN